MELKSLLASTKQIEVEFPGMEGFKLKVVYLGKEKLRKIMNNSKTMGFDRSSRLPTETVDDQLFSELYVKEALVGWKGLKLEYLKELVLLDEDEMKKMEKELPEDWELPYSEASAVQLVNNAKDLDTWLTSVISDISLFNKGS